MNYHVYTALKETHARPASEYLVCGVNTESEAVQKLYDGVKNGLQPIKPLGQYQIPDYTCGFRDQPYK